MAYETLKVGNKNIVLNAIYTIGGGSVDCHKIIKGKLKNTSIKKITAVNNSVVKLDGVFNDYYVKTTADSLNMGFRQNFRTMFLGLFICGSILTIGTVVFLLLSFFVSQIFL